MLHALALLTCLGAGTIGGADEPAPADAIAARIKAGEQAQAAAAARELLARLEGENAGETLEAARALDLLVEASWRGELTPPTGATAADGERAASLRERLSGPDDPGLATSLHLLGNLLQGRSDLVGARSVYERSLAIRERVFGRDALEVVPSLNNLGAINRVLGDYAASRETLERALAIRVERLPPEDRGIAVSRRSLGITLNAVGDYGAAEQLFRAAIETVEAAGSPDILLANLFNDLGMVLIQRGSLEEAEVALRRSIELNEQLLGADHPDLWFAVGNLATLRRDLGDFAEARRLQERALKLVEPMVETRPAEVANALNNLGHLFLMAGDVRGAQPVLERALALLRRALPEDGTDTALVLTNLGHVARHSGDFPAARRYYESALAIYDRVVGRRHLEFALVLSDIGMATMEAGQYTEAAALFLQALDILREAVGEQAVPTGLVARQLSRARLSAGQFAQAREWAERASVVLDATLGPEHPHSAEARVDLARCLALTGDPTGALEAAVRAGTANHDFVRLTIQALPERQALALASSRPAVSDLVLSLATRSNDAEFVRRSWDLVIRGRGLVLDEMARRVGVASPAGAVVAVQQQLAAARNRLLRLLLQEPEPAAATGHRREVEEARREKEGLELSLADASAPFHRELRMTRRGLEEVARALPSGTGLVSFVFFRDVLARGEDGKLVDPPGRYAAFVLPPDGGAPRLIPLGEAAAIDAKVLAWRREAIAPALAGLRRGAEQRYREAGASLREAIWDPLRDARGSATLVIVVPDGVLHFVNLAVLPDAEGGYLTEHAPTVHLLTTERDLLREPGEVPAGRGLLALGGPDFDAVRAVVGAPRVPVAAPSAAGAPRLRAALARGGTVRFEALPGTTDEVHRVATAWREQAGDEAAVELLAAAATEAAFKAGAPGKRVLHVATHGFFLPQDQFGVETGYGEHVLGRWSVAASRVAPADNPLLLSGLALAGANRGLGDDGSATDDGLLVAEEIASLDLRGVEWAVLSACETAMGEFVSGEGILGLRRAALSAGARTVVMSLWRVDDAATGAWIEALYRARYAAGRPTADAVKEANRSVIAARRRAGESTHPFYWGAFVAAGDWR